MMRKIINDAMDVISGRGIQRGPRNNLATGYAACPVAITVEGANILTRNLMIFGQGAIRCHPFVFPEMEAARTNDAAAFDKLLFGHIGFSINRGVRAFTHGITGAAFAKSPVEGSLGRYFRQMERMSSALAFVSDVTMGVLGGELKRKERLSARLGDVLSQLYIASAVAKFYLSGTQTKEDYLHARWALDNALYEIGKAFEGFFDNFPMGAIGSFLKFVVFPFGNPYKPVGDRLNQRIADLLMEETEVRERITWLVFKNGGPRDPVGRFEHAWDLVKKAEAPYVKYFKLAAKGELAGDDTPARLKDAVNRNLLTREEADLAGEFDKVRFDVIQTDHFSKAYIAGDFAADRNAALVDLAARRGQAA